MPGSRAQATVTILPRRVPNPGPSAAASGAPAPERASAQPQGTGTHAGRKGQLAYAGALPPARIPAESLVPARYGKVAVIALVASIAVHALVLAVHFSPFDFSRFKDQGPALEVALVNAKSQTRPAKADILAQANLDGGGNTDQKRRAKSPLPVLPREQPQHNVEVAASPAPAPENTTQEMLTQRTASVSVPAPEPKPVDAVAPTESPTANELMQKTLQAMRLEAQIARDMDAYQKRPKRRYVGARATEYRFARYVEDWRMKVERIGNLNYPEAARENKLYGSLVLTVAIRSDGSLDSVKVNHSSGERILDAAAVKIVEMAAPYAPFPENIRRDTDILYITRTWTFARGDELHGE
jgi:protein TonB